MKIPYKATCKAPAVATLALVAGLLSLAPSVASAAIMSGSTMQFGGSAQISAANDIQFIGVGPVLPGFDADIRINIAGNTGSFAGYNVPNPNTLPLDPNYGAGFTNISGGMAPAGTFISLPEIIVGPGEPGPIVGPARFVASSLVTSFGILDGVTFFNAVGQGTIFDDSDGTSVDGTLSLSTQNFDASVGAINSFSATLTAGTTVIPVPAAAWMLGSGLLAMIAAGRRRKA
jgi:hypothetical protein